MCGVLCAGSKVLRPKGKCHLANKLLTVYHLGTPGTLKPGDLMSTEDEEEIVPE